MCLTIAPNITQLEEPSVSIITHMFCVYMCVENIYCLHAQQNFKHIPVLLTVVHVAYYNPKFVYLTAESL